MFEYRQRVERALDRLGDLPTPDIHLEMRLHTALGYSLWYSGPDTDPARMQRSFDFAGKLAKRSEMRISCSDLFGELGHLLEAWENMIEHVQRPTSMPRLPEALPISATECSRTECWP
jgi:hypothetical protein